MLEKQRTWVQLDATESGFVRPSALGGSRGSEPRQQSRFIRSTQPRLDACARFIHSGAVRDNATLHLVVYWSYNCGLEPLSTRMIQQTNSHVWSLTLSCEQLTRERRVELDVRSATVINEMINKLPNMDPVFSHSCSQLGGLWVAITADAL